MNKIDLQALYLSGSYCHKTGIRPPSCDTLRQPTINAQIVLAKVSFEFYILLLETSTLNCVFCHGKSFHVFSKNKSTIGQVKKCEKMF